MSSRAFSVAAGVLTALSLGVSAAAAQAPAEPAGLYEREVFQYGRAGRADPFRSLLSDPELGMRLEDLKLLGVIYHPDPALSVAVLSQTGSTRRIRGRAGDRIGGIRIVSIGPRSVDLVVEEFGVARRETLELRPASERGSS